MADYRMNFNSGGLAQQSYYDPLNTLSPAQGAYKVPEYGTPIKSLAEVQTDVGKSAVNGATTPSWMANAQAFSSLGLGLASFLDQRKTAGLQRDALRQNLSVAREHQANRKALGDSWNKAWS
jgi:hypothetical protein